MTTPFQNQVYSICKRIPKGRVTTYKAIASLLGGGNAYRAVGNALNKNPFAPEVPCHRVVSSDGSIGGFAYGLTAKVALLKKEGIEVKNGKVVDFTRKVYRF